MIHSNHFSSMHRDRTKTIKTDLLDKQKFEERLK